MGPVPSQLQARLSAEVLDPFPDPGRPLRLRLIFEGGLTRTSWQSRRAFGRGLDRTLWSPSVMTNRPSRRTSMTGGLSQRAGRDTTTLPILSTVAAPGGASTPMSQVESGAAERQAAEAR